ncbi:MAG: hypothetical protein HZB29_09870 [Nitrospinae bacterium]|nr:hypothetical protein [Nitrospinota bacterium]
MKIKLRFPADSLAAIARMGLRQKSPETLRWTADHPDSSYGIGIILRGKSGDRLGGKEFAVMRQRWGAWIEVDSAETKRRAANALYLALTDTPEDAIRVVEENENKM